MAQAKSKTSNGNRPNGKAWAKNSFRDGNPHKQVSADRLVVVVEQHRPKGKARRGPNDTATMPTFDGLTRSLTHAMRTVGALVLKASDKPVRQAPPTLTYRVSDEVHIGHTRDRGKLTLTGVVCRRDHDYSREERRRLAEVDRQMSNAAKMRAMGARNDLAMREDGAEGAAHLDWERDLLQRDADARALDDAISLWLADPSLWLADPWMETDPTGAAA